MGPAGRELECLEVLMSLPGSLGQQLHKDAWVEDGDDVLNGLVNLNGAENQTTVFPKYPCERFPQCVSPEALEPLNWESLEKAVVEWGLGDSIVFSPWIVHGAPLTEVSITPASTYSGQPSPPTVSFLIPR